MTEKPTASPRRSLTEMVREMQAENARDREAVLRSIEIARQLAEVERRRARWCWWR